jgi:16S rRNA (adenine1518-N6/adenine1519-N6)-dimethyltransferase
MVQKEVAKRLCSTCKDSDYGAITASVNYYGKVVELFDVQPSNFLPAPNVVSTVIRIELYEKCPYTVSDEKTLFEVISGAFAQRRKTLVNAVSAGMNISKEDIKNVLSAAGLNETVRAESLSMEQLAKVSRELCKIKA